VEMPTTGRIWPVGPTLDQGREGACVGMGCAGAVAAAPSSRSGINRQYAVNWYRRAQRLDEWPGEAYPGTSVLAGCLVGRERKLWAGFRWSKHPAELAAGLNSDDLGPAIVGVQWSEDLYDVPPDGLLPEDVTLDPNMGHCVLGFGYVPSRALITRDMQADLEELGLWEAVDQLAGPSFLILNSWGPSWGVHGMAVVPLPLMRRWFAARGEFALPEQRTKGKAGAVAQGAEPVETETGTGAATAAPVDATVAPVDPDAEQSGDVTLHITAAEVQDGDRILDPPEGLGQESATVTRPPVHSTAFGGRRVTVPTTAGSFQLGAGEPVTVRRQQ
jgi:hypothetical protein